MSAFTHLFTPIRIGRVDIPNRICHVPTDISSANADGSVNPRVIARNHQVEQALQAASTDGDLGPFERLLAALHSPYDNSIQHAAYAEPAPASVTACYRTFCGT
jgi:uncharacterized protein YdiU (UPF0061 family)